MKIGFIPKQFKLIFLTLSLCFFVLLGCRSAEDNGSNEATGSTDSTESTATTPGIRYTSLAFNIDVPEDSSSTSSKLSNTAQKSSSDLSKMDIGDTDEVFISVSARNEPAFINSQPLTKDGNLWKVELDRIPLDTLLIFSVEAYDRDLSGDEANTPTYLGTTTKSLTDADSSVIVVLRRNGKEQPAFPRVVKVVRPRQVRQDASVDIGIEFLASPGEEITYELFSDPLVPAGQAGTFTPSTATTNLSTGNRASVLVQYVASSTPGDYSHFIKVTNEQNNSSQRGFKIRIADESSSDITAAFSPDVKYMGIIRTIDSNELQLIPEIDAEASTDLSFSWSYYSEEGSASIKNDGTNDINTLQTLTLVNVDDTTKGTAVLTVSANYGGDVGVLKTVISQYLIAEKIQIAEKLNATKLAIGGTHSCALLSNTDLDTSVKCWGDNTNGELGVGSTFDNINSPLVLPDQTHLLHITSGNGFSCATYTDKTVKCWGKNDKGQLGVGDQTVRLDPTVPQGGLNDVQEMAAGDSHVCALLGTTKNLYCWGKNDLNQVGSQDGGAIINTPFPVAFSTAPERDLSGNVVKVDAGANHTCALLEEGTVACWGSDKYGQLGIDPSEYTSLGITDTENPSTWSPVKVANLTGVTDIAVGKNHTCAIRGAEGLVLCWGQNDYRQLGILDSVDTYKRKIVLNVTEATSISSNGDFTCAILESGRMKCWGKNDRGQLGNGLDDNPMAPDFALNSLSVKEVSAGENHACAILNDGAVKCWGDNSENQLSYETNNADIGTRSFVPLDADDELLNPIDPSAEFFVGTTLLTTPGNQYLFNGWYADLARSTDKTRARVQEWTLCYRKSTHGASISTFHSRCNEKGETVTVVKGENGAIFGAYAPNSWKNNDSSYPNGGYIPNSGNSFLFSFAATATAKCTGTTDCQYRNTSYGPAFGTAYNSSNYGYGFRIYNNMSSYYYHGGYGFDTITNFAGSGANSNIAEVEIFYRSF